MKETRAAKYGRALVSMVRPVVLFYSPKKAEDYIDILDKEVNKYSFRKRKVTEPVHEGCFWSLGNLERLNSFDPVETALFIRESFDQTYNKDRALNMFYSFMNALENLREDIGDGTL
jgi:hypothetical protein